MLRGEVSPLPFASGKASLAQGFRLQGFLCLSSSVLERLGLMWKRARKLMRSRRHVVFSNCSSHTLCGCGNFPYKMLLSGCLCHSTWPAVPPPPVTKARITHRLHTLAGSEVLVILFGPLQLWFLLPCPPWKKQSPSPQNSCWGGPADSLHLGALPTPSQEAAPNPLSLYGHSPSVIVAWPRPVWEPPHPGVPSAQHFVAPPQIATPS